MVPHFESIIPIIRLFICSAPLIAIFIRNLFVGKCATDPVNILLLFLLKSDMEEFDVFGNDFLSNGEFHHLYTTFDTHDDICLWDNRIDFEFQSKWNITSADSIGKNAHSEYSQFDHVNYCGSDFNTSTPSQADNESAINYHVFNEMAHESIESTPENFITDMDEWKQSHLDDLVYHSNNNNDWELNLENLIMEHPNDDSVFNVCNLPARTYYCNDSCTNFLQEASEHLDTSLRTFQPNIPMRMGSTHSNDSVFKFNSRKKFPLANEEKEFVCNFGDCRKVYAKAGHLKAHIRRHIGDKPYVCSWPNCTWKFSRSDELSRHRRSHSGIKPYQCDLCPKCFSRSDHLTKHRKVHERKMAAMKIKAVWTKLPPRKPGRKPKSQTLPQ